MSRNICTRICFTFPSDIKIWMLCVQNDGDCNKDWLRQWKWDPTTLWFYKDFEAFLYNSKIILKNAFANWVNCFYITPRDVSKSQQPEFVLEADLFLNTGIGNCSLFWPKMHGLWSQLHWLCRPELHGLSSRMDYVSRISLYKPSLTCCICNQCLIDEWPYKNSYLK